MPVLVDKTMLGGDLRQRCGALDFQTTSALSMCDERVRQMPIRPCRIGPRAARSPSTTRLVWHAKVSSPSRLFLFPPTTHRHPHPPTHTGTFSQSGTLVYRIRSYYQSTLAITSLITSMRDISRAICAVHVAYALLTVMFRIEEGVLLYFSSYCTCLLSPTRASIHCLCRYWADSISQSIIRVAFTAAMT